MNARFVLAWLVVVVVAAGVVASPDAADDRTLSDRAKAEVSLQRGIPSEELTVVVATPNADGDVVQFKVRDRTGRLFGVDLDRAGRRAGDEDDTDEARKKKRREKRDRDPNFSGKLEKELERALKRMRPDERIRVVMWMTGTTDAPRRGPGVTEAEHAANLQTVAGQVAAMMAAPTQHWTSMGGGVMYQPPIVPMVVAEGTRAMIETMERRADVQRIYMERTHAERLNISRVVAGSDVVNARGFTGVGQRVGVVERFRIADHASLPVTRTTCRPASSVIWSDHKTQVAGVIHSTHAAARGMAPLITIVDGIGADFSDAEMIAATDCVIDTQNARAVNMSFGSETNGVFDAFARYVDRKVYFTGATIIPAVSNVCANRMGTPEIAFNALAVGAFGDSNTTGFADDFHPCTLPAPDDFSAFLNPISPSGDRQEPDVVAPGHAITTTTLGGAFATVNGTSFAAPHVTGGVGLLFQRDPALRFQGERVRAVIMASARHNIEGATRLSDRDGAGGILLQAADSVLTDGLSSFFSTPGGTTGFPIIRTFIAFAGQRVRVAIAWAHKSPDGDALTRPTTDLDLSVTNPRGASVGGSFSFDNNYEIIDFVATVTGTYTATITNFRSSPGTEFIGFAASRLDF